MASEYKADSPLPNPVVAADFLSATLGKDIHLVSIKPDPGEGEQPHGRWFGDDAGGARDWAINENEAGKNVYWTVNVTREGLHKKPVKRDIRAARFLHVDVDPPKDGGAFDRGAILTALGEARHPPSFIVDSGNGLQAFWRLDYSAENQDAVEDLNRRIARLYGGDKRGSCLLWAVGIFIGLAVIGSLTDNRQDAGNSSASKGSMNDAEMKAYLADAQSKAADQPLAEPEPPRSAWSYQSQSSPMDDRRTELACVRSTNTVQLGFPYGSPYGRLCLRNSPQFGRDAYVALEGEGQILCPSYQDCTVRVRFDDAPARNFSGVGASDNSSNIVFLRGRDRVERALRTADRTAVEIEFYRAGNQAFIFPTAGFDWEAGRQGARQ